MKLSNNVVLVTGSSLGIGQLDVLVNNADMERHAWGDRGLLRNDQQQ
ncbi:MAG: hypothetical protein VKL98_09480 [Cyanobacteriota bacterium]|nr:hypothetical protein [Cyanobacteriota bacterium]